jgi:hypothetical protein
LSLKRRELRQTIESPTAAIATTGRIPIEQARVVARATGS